MKTFTKNLSHHGYTATVITTCSPDGSTNIVIGGGTHYVGGAYGDVAAAGIKFAETLRKLEADFIADCDNKYMRSNAMRAVILCNGFTEQK